MATRYTQYRSVASAHFEQRTMPRHRVQVTRASVRKRGGSPAEALLQDVSIYGCRFAARAGYSEGDRLWLRFPDSPPVAAVVVWSDGQYVGCRFDAPIERSLMRALTLVIC